MPGRFPPGPHRSLPRGSPQTARRLEELGLAGRVLPAEGLCARADLLLYCVGPPDFEAIAAFPLSEHALLFSFVGGISLDQLPARLSAGRRFRILTSAVDTLENADGLAAVYPSANPLVSELLSALHLEEVPLESEGEIHAMTAFGLCLPTALVAWEASGRSLDRGAYLSAARGQGLKDPEGVLRWAQRVRLRGLSEEARRRYFAQAGPPGGITEAILDGIEQGMTLVEALERGVERSARLGRGEPPAP